MSDLNFYVCEVCRYRKIAIDVCRRADVELMVALDNVTVALGRHDTATTQIAQARNLLADATMTLYCGLRRCPGRETLENPLPE